MVVPKIRDHIFPWQPTSEDDFGNQKDLESSETVPCTDGWTYNLTGLFTSAVTDVGNSWIETDIVDNENIFH